LLEIPGAGFHPLLCAAAHAHSSRIGSTLHFPVFALDKSSTATKLAERYNAHVSNDLGLGLTPGDLHYRAYVGPPEDYDLIAAMSFGLLTSLGLRQQHKVLDVGCGSLRIGRLLIPYLNAQGYFGIEPNKWLVEEAIEKEVGQSQIRIKEAQFLFADSPQGWIGRHSFDFAIAHSIFSHTGQELLDSWLRDVSQMLTPSGALVATFMTDESDTSEKRWVYPHCVRYTEGTIAATAQRHGLTCQILDWRHPRQTWALFARPGFDSSWFQDRPLSWNSFMEFTLGRI
jgi:SAM-dependent methyltransferase